MYFFIKYPFIITFSEVFLNIRLFRYGMIYIFLLFLHVYTCVCVFLYMVGACVFAGYSHVPVPSSSGHKLMSCIFMDCFPPHALTRACCLASLSSQLALGIPCHFLLSLGLQVSHPACLTITWLQGIRTLVLMLTQHVLNHWVTSLAYRSLFAIWFTVFWFTYGT